LGKTVKVSDQVWSKLMELKRRDRHTSIDSVIRTLLLKAGEAL